MLSITSQTQLLGPLANIASILNSRLSTQPVPFTRSGKSKSTTAGHDGDSCSLSPTGYNRVTACLQHLGFEANWAPESCHKLTTPIMSGLEESGTQISRKLASHVSRHSFFENKNGFSPEVLDLTHRVLNKADGPWSMTPLLQTLSWSTKIFVPSRGFKTRRSSPDGEVSEDGFSRLFRGQNKEQKSDKFKTILAEFESSPKIQEKLKLSFAEGYALYSAIDKSASSSKSWTNRAVKVILYAFCFWCLIQIVQLSGTVGGSIRGLGVLNREQYEVNPEEITVSFDDVKGVDEAKQELQDVVEFLKDPDKFTALGAKLPKGVLLVGPPGVGKTLLARAVAGEAEVPFFHASGSEFDEIFVGTGAKRVRQLFSAAKVRAPCVIFIDEIDTVGAKRTSSQIHPYANQTINQLLSEMDGFQQNEGVIVLGATNRRDNLDRALLRPGRFDVEVTVFAPDLKGRQDIIHLYLQKVKYDPDVDVDKLARGTAGFTGADIENVVNQAALKAAMDLATTVTMTHLEFARDKVMMGPAKKSRIPDEETNWITAYHEAGHTLVAYYTKDSTPLHKVTIIQRGQSLGHTAFLPEKEYYNRSKAQLLAQMDVSMGGRVAEELVFGADKVTTGASSDFQQATAIASAMVRKFGMSEKVGVRVFDDEAIDGGLSMLKVNEVSPATTELVDNEIKRILQESYERAKVIIRTHSAIHKDLAKALMKHETLDRDDIQAIVEGKKDFVPSVPAVL